MHPNQSTHALFHPGLPRLLAIGGFLVVAQLGGCSCDDPVGKEVTVGDPFTKFTVNELPAVVNKAQLPVSGTSNLNTTVWASVNAGDPASIAQVGGLAGENWSSTLTIVEGENTLSFHPRTDSGAMGDAIDRRVILDTMAPGAPTLDEAVPECVPQGTFTFTGSAEPGATVTVNGMTVTADEAGKFEVSITVSGAGTSVNITATDAAGNTSPALIEELVAGLPAPTITNFVSPTNETTQTFTGTKAAGTSVWLINADSSEEEIVAASDDTTWTAELTFPEGQTTFALEGRTSGGEKSCGTSPYDLLVSDVCPVDVDDSNFPVSTNDPNLTVPGTKCTGTSVNAFREGQTFVDATQYVPLNNEESFSFDYTLTEGPNTFFVILKDTNNLPGPADGPFTVILDTVAPNAPIFVPDPPPSTLETTLRLTGTKDANTNVCLRVDAQQDCAVVFPQSAGTDFAFNHTLHPELNFLCISSFDAAGNQSPETCATVDQGAGSGVQIVAPLNGSIIGDAPFDVVVLAQEDGEIPAERVSICLDSVCVDAAPAGGTQWEESLMAGAAFENGTVHTVSATGYRANGSAFGMAQITVVYIVDGLLLSDSEPEESSARPRLALDGEGVLHVVWADNCSQSDDCTDSQPGNLPADIFHRSFDQGQWSSINLVSDARGDGNSRDPVVVTDEVGNIHVIWTDNGNILDAGTDDDLFHRSYDAVRGRWGDVSLVTENGVADQFPDVAVGGGKLHVVWQARTDEDGPSDIDVFYRSQTIASSTWGDQLKLSDQNGNERSELAAVAVDSTGRAWVAWQERGDVLGGGADRDIILRSVSTAGVLGTAILVTNNNLDGESSQVDLLVDNDDMIQVVWQDTASVFSSGDDLDIYHRSYDANNTATPSPYALVSNNPMDGQSRSPVLALNPDTNGLFIAWVEQGDINGSGTDADIYFVRGQLGVFGPLEQVTSNAFTMTSESPDVLFDPITRTLHFVWEDDTTLSNDGTDRDVFYLGIPLED